MDIINCATVFKFAVETTVEKMVLAKASGCVLMAVWLFALTSVSGNEVQFDLKALVLYHDTLNL